MDDKILQIRERLNQAKFAVVFTGAGISTESGIPDFRSPGGIWATSQPVMYNDFMADPAARYEYWRQKAVAHRDFADSEPNTGHKIVAQWEAAGKLKGVITQNIDGLHQIAGSENVVEVHGTARQISCLDCNARFDAGALVKKFLDEDKVPLCPLCGSDRMKHATISFGQQLDETTINTAIDWASRCDLLFAMGSSLVVEPAAGIPRLAKQNGATLVIINRDPTPQDDSADFVINDSIGKTLGAIGV
ncbi:MAG: NAD-dependent deacetylase [Pirellulaceae bacterium]|jgi:NAD-dependent deacetylase